MPKMPPIAKNWMIAANKMITGWILSIVVILLSPKLCITLFILDIKFDQFLSSNA